MDLPQGRRCAVKATRVGIEPQEIIEQARRVFDAELHTAESKAMLSDAASSPIRSRLTRMPATTSTASRS
jgi:hypothetical protein